MNGCVVVQSMKLLHRGVRLSETLYAEAQNLLAMDSVSYHTHLTVTNNDSDKQLLECSCQTELQRKVVKAVQQHYSVCCVNFSAYVGHVTIFV